MSLFSRNTILGLSMSLVLAGALGCGDDGVASCPDTPCGAGSVCVDSTCIPQPIENPRCERDGDCEPGRICLFEACELGCNNSIQCPPNQYCNTSNNAFSCEELPKECSDDRPCPGGLICTEGGTKCIECETTSDCGEKGFCNAAQLCVGCRRNDDCGQDSTCDVSRGTCSLRPAQCDLVGQVCTEGLRTKQGFVCGKRDIDGAGPARCWQACGVQDVCIDAFATEAPITGNTPEEIRANIDKLEVISRYFAAPLCPDETSCRQGASGGEFCHPRECDDPIQGVAQCNPEIKDGQRVITRSCQPIVVSEDATLRQGRDDPYTARDEEYGNFFFRLRAGPEGNSLFSHGTQNRAAQIFRDETFVCQEIGTLQRGDLCGSPTNAENALACGAGLTCVKRIGRYGFGFSLISNVENLRINITSQIAGSDPKVNYRGKAIDGSTDGICQRPCNSDTQCDVAAGETCIGDQTGLIAPGVGFCGLECEAFSSFDPQDCPNGASCFPVGQGTKEGWCGEFDVVVDNFMNGGRPAFENASLFDRPGDSIPYGNCFGDTDCPGNTTCTNITGTSRCHPRCDSTLRAQNERDQSCGVPSAPTGYVKIVHAASAVGDVDVYLDGRRVATALKFGQIAQDQGQVGAWIAIPAGPKTLSVIQTGKNLQKDGPLLTKTLNVQTNKASYELVLAEGGTTRIDSIDVKRSVPAIFDPPQAAADNASFRRKSAQVRVYHLGQGVGAIDVVAVKKGDQINRGDPIARGVTFGNVSAYGEIRTARADAPLYSHQVYAFPAGVPLVAGNELIQLPDRIFERGFVGTLLVFSEPGGANATAQLLEDRQFEYVVESGSFCLENFALCLQRCGSDPAQYTSASNVCVNNKADQCRDIGIGVCFANAKSTSTRCQSDAQCPATQFCDDSTPGFGRCVQKYCNPGEEGCCTDDAECGNGYFCDGKGLDQFHQGTLGVCRALCSPVGNAALPACQAGERCFATRTATIGECHIPCTPEGPKSLVDRSCPENQQTCRPHENGVYYCSASGNKGINEECAVRSTIVDPSTDLGSENPWNPGQDTTCTAGTICTREFKVIPGWFSQLVGAFNTPNFLERNVCRPMCRPFLPEGSPSDCPSGFACNPSLPGEFSVFSGVCMPRTSSVSTSTRECPPQDNGLLCGDSSYCVGTEPRKSGSVMGITRNLTPLDEGQEPTYSAMPEEILTCERKNGECLDICDFATKRGCPPNKTCEQSGTIDYPQLFIGRYGICRDST